MDMKVKLRSQELGSLSWRDLARFWLCIDRLCDAGPTANLSEPLLQNREDDPVHFHTHQRRKCKKVQLSPGLGTHMYPVNPARVIPRLVL